MKDLNQLRREFKQNPLHQSELKLDPFAQFEIWLEEAIKMNISLPNAMSLATMGFDNLSIRTVLLKDFDSKGFVFFTNYDSKKSKQIGINAKAALLFSWLDLQRQVKISGSIEKVSLAESIRYFATRPRNSQLAAWASHQSAKIPSRQHLTEKFTSIEAKFAKQKVPLPDFWGGYRVLPDSIEFWQGQENRLHDRFIYEKNQQKWLISRLAP